MMVVPGKDIDSKYCLHENHCLSKHYFNLSICLLCLYCFDTFKRLHWNCYYCSTTYKNTSKAKGCVKWVIAFKVLYSLLSVRNIDCSQVFLLCHVTSLSKLVNQNKTIKRQMLALYLHAVFVFSCGSILFI